MCPSTIIDLSADSDYDSDSASENELPSHSEARYFSEFPEDDFTGSGSLTWECHTESLALLSLAIEQERREGARKRGRVLNFLDPQRLWRAIWGVVMDQIKYPDMYRGWKREEMDIIEDRTVSVVKKQRF